MKPSERYPEPKTASEKQAAQMRRMNGVRTVEEAEAAADRAAAPKRRTYIETGDHGPAVKRHEKTATEKQAEQMLYGP
jgi:hypothetical protein